MEKFFPIVTDTSCRLKWSWSTIYLNTGTTASCHRASTSLIPEDFAQFHNTPEKKNDRAQMLRGEWPGNGCEYCKNIEDAGGVSERQFQNKIPEVYPSELNNNQTLVEVDPAIVEVFFANTCNLGCVYCNASLSSAIQMEDQTHGGPKIPGLEFVPTQNKYRNFNEKFWDWLQQHSKKIQRFHILGGEPFLQKDFRRLLDFFESTEHPQLEFSVVTNLSLNNKLLSPMLQRLAELKINNKVKRIDLQVSIDSWHKSQEYVRYGLDLDVFDQNMQFLLDSGAYRIGLLSTVSSLTINGMPELAQKYIEWNKTNTIFWYMILVLPNNTSVFDPTIFDYEVFEQSLNLTRELLPKQTWDDQRTLEVFDGVVSKLKNNCKNNIPRQLQLLDFLKINDKRRNTSWQQEFPWLVDVFKKNNVV